MCMCVFFLYVRVYMCMCIRVFVCVYACMRARSDDKFLEWKKITKEINRRLFRYILVKMIVSVFAEHVEIEKF